MLVFQHFQFPLHFILHKNGGSKVKVAYCCLVIYELNSMSVSDYHPTCGRQFLATKMKVKWKFDMDIGQHGGLPSTPPRFVKRARFFRFFSGTLPLFSEHFTTFSISSNHRNFFVPFPFPFPSIPGNNSLWFPFPNFGNVFFHSLPVPEFRECLFSFPSRSRILGMDFFIPFPFPNFGNGIFNSLPVPKHWEWNFLFPFPFPNPQKSFPLTPAHVVSRKLCQTALVCFLQHYVHCVLYCVLYCVRALWSTIAGSCHLRICPYYQANTFAHTN